MVNVGEHLAGDGGESCLGVSHCSGGVAVNGSEVSLTINEWMAHGEVLRQSDECVIKCAVAVWVVLTHDFTDDRGALAIRGASGEAHFAHGVENAAVNRLEAVTHIWKGTCHDHAHGVIEVARAHLVFNADRLHAGDAHAARANPVCAVIYWTLPCWTLRHFVTSLLCVRCLASFDVVCLIRRQGSGLCAPQP